MNISQIQNGEVRIFPYYKGEYLGVEPVGYSNIKTAMHYMRNIPSADVYERFGGEEQYKKDYQCFYGLDKKRKSPLYDGSTGWNSMFYREGCYRSEYNDIHYAKDLPDEVLTEYNKLLDKLGYSFDTKLQYENEIREFEEKYNVYPHLFVDNRKFDAMERKIRKDEIEYRKGILKITVEYIKEDENNG